MRSHSRFLMSAAVFVLVAAPTLLPAQGHPVFGSWELNVAKSKYDPGPGPKSSTRTYTAAANGGYTLVTKGVDAQGKAVDTHFEAAFDGKFHVMHGSPNADSIMVKQVDANTVESTQKKGDKVVTHTTRVMGKDGKSFTSTSTGTNASGVKFKNVEVFEKK